MAGEFAGNARFSILRRLGAGGMGVVYEALDRERNERIALKALRQPSADAILRLKREFHVLEDVSHPNLISLGELFCEDHRWFFTMELLDGVSFVEFVRGGAWVPLELADTMHQEELPTSSTQGVPMLARTGAVTVAGLDRPNATRLANALAQLACGLDALHAAGRVHRDIKPPNVMITRDERLVLLDFGLVAADDGRHDDIDAQIVGTSAYMAPEQAAGGAVGPAADWYAVGAMTYEALTGRPPFVGNVLDVLTRKQWCRPPEPAQVAPDVPRDLSELCMRLLAIDPSERPRARDVLRVLEARGTRLPEVSLGSGASGSQTGVFVGREAELATLMDAFETARTSGHVRVFVEADSGLGKTVLVRRFLDRVAVEHPNAVVLHGRCYEREAVPYKAVDGVVDALGRHLARLSRAEVEALLPMRIGLLAQLFPVLRRVEAIADAPRLTADGRLDPQILRTRAFTAFRELLGALARKQPLVVSIDDLHWADADSLALLGEVLHPPDAPRLLFVATTRPPTGSASAPAWAPSSPLFEGEVALRHVSLAPLDERESAALAQELLQRSGVLGPAEARAIAVEAAGHPLFIAELSRHGRAGPARGLSLEEALKQRVALLSAPERAVLEVLAVARRPLPFDIAARATALPPTELSRHVTALRVHHMVRSSGARGGDPIEPFHDRISQAVLQSIEPARRVLHHRRIALALEASDPPDVEALSLHWREAGEPKKASHYAVLAADAASAALAFDQAADFYRGALAAGAWDAEERRALRVKLAFALSNAGRGAEAAREFREAARGAPAAQTLDLDRRAAEQLLRSGQIDEGLDALAAVLATVSMRMPRSPWVALVLLLATRAVLRVRGLSFVERDASRAMPLALTRIDACWSVGLSLPLVDTVRGAYFQARGLLFALAAGEPSRVARAISMEAAYAAAAGARGRERTTYLVSRARELAERVGDAHAAGLAAAAAASAANLEGRFEESLALADRAAEILRERCAGSAFEIATVQHFALESLAYMGRMRALVDRVAQVAREAEERGDLYGTVVVRMGITNLAWLVRDDVAGARRAAHEALSRWSNRRFFLQHFLDMVAQTHIDLYEGQGRAAYERVRAGWAAVLRSLILTVEFSRIVAYGLRGRAALAAAVTATGHARTRLLRDAERCARRLEREKASWAQPAARLLRAGLARQRGDIDAAKALLREGARELDAVGMRLHAAAAQRALGVLSGGAEGETLVAGADERMMSEDIRKPERMVALYVPGTCVIRA